MIPKALLRRIDEKLLQIQSHRPLSGSLTQKLKEQFSIEMTYNSNAIEGNRLTLKETFLVINEGITVKGKSLKDHLEAKNHRKLFANQRTEAYYKEEKTFLIWQILK
ncbi:MAG: hypothetical protein AAGB31_02680 [Bdellovibrio sp.]